MASWFNISGNLSSIASNVTNFTKEVLQDAATDTYQDPLGIDARTTFESGPSPSSEITYDSSDELLRNVSCLQEELHRMANDIAYRDEQIVTLENQNVGLAKEYERHFTFLNQDLLEKEKELEEFAKKINDNELIYGEKEAKLTAEISFLKSELAERKESLRTFTMDDDSSNECNESTQGKEIKELELANESLSNEVIMKEIVLNSIESKMFDVSQRPVEAADFSEWIDEIISKKVLAEEKNKQIIDILDKHVKQDIDSRNISQFSQWLTDQGNVILKLESEIIQYKEIISQVETSVTEFEGDSNDFTINHFSQWLNELRKNDEKKEKSVNNRNDNYGQILENIQSEIRGFDEEYRNFKISNFKSWLTKFHSRADDLKSGEIMLRKIESEIREFDEEDEDFEIENFHRWLEKVQCRIDDLEVEVVNEQESRELEEKQRVIERDTLEELFKQKQNEISLLKVELYKKNSSPYMDPVVNMKQEDLMTAQEELNEITARCDSLEIELSSMSKQLVEAKEKFEICESEKKLIEMEMKEFKDKYNHAEEQLFCFHQKDNEHKYNHEKGGQEGHDAVKSDPKKVNRQLSDSNLSNTKFDDELNNLESDFFSCAETEKEKIIETLRSEIVQLEEINKDLCSKNDKLFVDNDAMHAGMSAIMSLLPDTNKGGLQSKHLTSTCELFTFLRETIEDIIGKYTDSQKEIVQCNHIIGEYKQTLEEENEKLDFCGKYADILLYLGRCLDKVLPERYMHQIVVNNSLFSVEMSDYAAYMSLFEEFMQECNSSRDNLHSENADLKNHIENIEKLLELESTANERYVDELDKLNSCVDEYKKTVEHYKSELSKSTSGGGAGMKFGTMKRKLQDLESINQSLTRENEQLKNSNSAREESTKASTADEVAKLTYLLNDKTQECECYAEECKLLKSSLLEMQGQITIANSVYEECHQLKEKLIEYENALEAHSSTSSQIDPDEVSHATQFHQEQLHNLSLMLTEKNEELECRKGEIEQLKSKLIEVENETSSLELVREECKQLKTMLVGKEHQSRVDETITSLQTESKQLKQLLYARDSEMQGLQNILIEKENELSDMALIQEECKQLKQMLINDNEKTQMLNDSHSLTPSRSLDSNPDVSQQLMEAMMDEKDMQISQKDAIITELRNKTSDMDLIQEECRQLKLMLLDKGHAQSESSATGVPEDTCKSSIEQQMQQLEECLHEKDKLLKEKEIEFDKINALLFAKESLMSDFDLIQNESQILKQMLSDKEKIFNELQSDLDAANDMIQQKNQEFKSLEIHYVELERNLRDIIETQDNEIRNLNEELSETMAQDENLHILQTEYRKVLEHSNIKENELNNVLEKLSATENNCQHLRENLQMLQTEYRNVEEHLKVVENELIMAQKNLTVKENDLAIVAKQLNISDIESESVTHHHEEFNRLKTSLYQSEMNVKELRGNLETKDGDLEKLVATCNGLENHINKLNTDLTVRDDAIAHLNMSSEDKNRDIETLTNKFNKSFQECSEITAELNMSKLEIDTLQNEKSTLLALCSEKDSNLRLMEVRAADSEQEVLGIIKDGELLRKEKADIEERMKEKDGKINELTTKLAHYREETSNLEISARGDLQKMKEQEDKIWQLDTSLESLQKELQKNQETIDKSLDEINAKENQISLLETELVRSRECREHLDESINVQSAEKNATCKNCEYFNNEQKVINTISKNILKMLQIQTQNDNPMSIVEHISTIEGSVQSLLAKIQEEEKGISMLSQQNDELKIKLDEISEEKLLLVSNLEKDIEESNLMLIRTNDSCKQEIKDMQCQLREYEGLQVLYKQKCSETEDMEFSLTELKEKLTEMQLLEERTCSDKNKMEVSLKQMQNKNEEMQSFYENKCSENKDLEIKLAFTENKHLEMHNLYETKCSECKDLELQLRRLLDENRKDKRDYENNSNSVLNDECEQLREELERSSLSYLAKNKECDTLRLEMLQLEETIYELKLSQEKMNKFREVALEVESLRDELNNKNEEINQLNSTIEDNQWKFESRKKEKLFLDELVKAKEKLEQEQKELISKADQLGRLVQERDVLLRHKDISHRELEAKNNRELERLRNHMMMTEDMHTKDIIECHEREKVLQQALDEVKQGLSKKSIILHDSSKQFQEHVVDLEEQLHVLSSQRDAGVLEVAKCQDKIKHDEAAIYNLQIALEQLEKEKNEQAEYLTLYSKRKETEYEKTIHELTDELNKTQGAMSEATLAVQGINKLTLELQQKENELKVSKEKINELGLLIQKRDMEFSKLMEAADTKLDKSLLRNLFMKYFEAPSHKRGDILHVIGRLLGWSPEEMQKIGSGSAQSKVGGWISNVWGYSTPRKEPPKETKYNFDSDKSFSELFIKFLEIESTSFAPVNTTSLTLNSVSAPSIKMFTPSTPDILAFHNNTSDQRIPAPGQEIPRVHTSHAQSTLKSILS